MTTPHPKEAPHPRIDHAKSERQLKGLDGDAIAEDENLAKDHPHKEIFEADGSDPKSG